MNKIILLVVICLLTSCVEMSNRLKVYKLVAGGYDTTGDEKRKTELIYNGEKMRV